MIEWLHIFRGWLTNIHLQEVKKLSLKWLPCIVGSFSFDDDDDETLHSSFFQQISTLTKGGSRRIISVTPTRIRGIGSNPSVAAEDDDL